MDRKLFGLFSGWHLTAMFAIAVLAPSAVVAAVQYQAVSIVNPSTGSLSYVDGARRLYVLDPLAAYRNNPSNYVDISISSTGTRCQADQQYTVPADRSLVITSISGYLYRSTAAYAGYYLYLGADCTGGAVTSNFASVSTTAPASTLAVDLGSGIPVPAGSTISLYSTSSNGYTHLHGYLAPSSAVPSATSVDNPFHGRTTSGQEMSARLKNN